MLNIFLTTLIETKRLKFNEGNATKKGKCFKMHVGNNKENCVKIKVHDREIEEVDSVTYLGDILNSSGKNDTSNISNASNA